MADIYISEDGDAVVDLQAYSAQYEKRIADLESEIRELMVIQLKQAQFILKQYNEKKLSTNSDGMTNGNR